MPMKCSLVIEEHLAMLCIWMLQIYRITSRMWCCALLPLLLVFARQAILISNVVEKLGKGDECLIVIYLSYPLASKVTERWRIGNMILTFFWM